MTTKAQKREARERRLATKEKHKLKLSPLETDLLGGLLTLAKRLTDESGATAAGLLGKLEKVTGKVWQAPLGLVLLATDEIDDTDLTNEDFEKLWDEGAVTPAEITVMDQPKIYILKGKGTATHYQQNPLVALSACGRYFNDPSVADNEGFPTDVACGTCRKTLRNEGLLPRE